MITFTCL